MTSLMHNAKHTGDDRVAVGIPAEAGRECCALLAAHTELWRLTALANPNNGRLLLIKN